MIKLAVLLGALVLSVVLGQDPREITAPDMIRIVYLKLEKLLWDKEVGKKSRNEQLKNIFIEHNNFIKTFFADSVDIDDLKSLIEANDWHHLQLDIMNVHRLFFFFRQHVAGETKNSVKGIFNKEMSLDLSEIILNDSNWPLKESLEKLFRVTMKENLYVKHISANFTCESQKSVQQILFPLYEAFAIFETEVYMMFQWSHMIRTVYQKADSSSVASLLRNEFEEMTIKCLQKSVEIFEKADRTLWRCDPKNHVENSTYLQITRLLQGHIENEIDLNKDHTCKETCNTYVATESFSCAEKSICREQTKCKGELLNCSPLKETKWVCIGDEESSKRYETISFADGYNYDWDTGPCVDAFHVYEGRMWWLFWSCDNCFCICDEQGKKSDRFFSLKEVLSDVKNNMVVTGIKFVKVDRIIHLQIQEGRLTEYGKINSTSVRWVPISKFSILDKGIKEGHDYHLLKFRQREVDLDDLIAPDGHVVTGVKFWRLGSHLNLKIRVSEISFSTGIVASEKSFWVWNNKTENLKLDQKRSEVHLQWPDVPTNTVRASLPVSRPNTFVKFTHSDIEKDDAQTTVPFLDSQVVSAEPPVPLQGVGLQLKAQAGFGGFIAPKIMTLDYTSFIKANIQNLKTATSL